VADSCFHEAVCRQRPELSPTFGYMKLCGDRDLNCGRYLVSSLQYLKTQSALCQAVYGER
jgi:hypothetical protein